MERMKPKNFIMTTMNGMVYGLFATLIIGVIVRQFGILIGLEIIEVTLADALMALMGVGIGMGIALSLKLDGLKMVVASVMGGIATSFKVVFGSGIIIGLNNDPVTVYLVVVLGIFFLKYVLVKKTPLDILLIPLAGVVVAFLLTLIISAPITFVLTQIQNGIASLGVIMTSAYDRSGSAGDYAIAIIMSMVIAVVMGMLLTSPISSAAIAITIGLGGIAGGVALVGCTVQMIGFAVQSRKDNNIGMMLSIAFGTSMLQFKNILKKPMIWLPTIITSAIMAPIVLLTLGMETTKFGAGMGTSGLVGQIQTLYQMNDNGRAWIAIFVTILGAILLVYAIDLLFRRFKWYGIGDLAVNNDIN